MTVAIAEARDVPVYLDEIGTAVASESVTIQPQVTGKILKRDFTDGDDIKVDQTLFEIDARPYVAALNQAKGQKDKDSAMYDNAKSVYDRDTKAMADNPGALSQSQVDADKASMNEATAAMAADQAAIEAAQVNVDYCTIKSPIAGRAGERLVDAGNVVSPPTQGGGTNLLTIQTLDPIYVDFTITEDELARVRDYMAKGTLTVEARLPDDLTAAAARQAPPSTRPVAAPGSDNPDESPTAGMSPAVRPVFQPRTGKLIFLDNAVQNGTGTVKLRAELPNKDRHFWPGQFVDVRLILTIQKGAVLIPNVASQVSQQGLFVFKVVPYPPDKSPTKTGVIQQTVTLGQRHGDMVVVESGLAAGDTVVATGQMLLQPGSPVMVVPAGPPPGAGGPPGGPPKAGMGTLKSPDNEGEPKGAATPAEPSTGGDK